MMMMMMMISSSGRHQVAPLQMMMMMMEEEENEDNNNLAVTKLNQLLTISGLMHAGITPTAICDFFQNFESLCLCIISICFIQL